MTIGNFVHGPMLLAVLLVIVTPAFAITLETYTTKIDSARRLALGLEDSIRKKEADDSKRRHNALKRR